MKKVELPQINELNGYLKCLARLSLKKCFFGSLAFESELEMDDFCRLLAIKWSERGELITPNEHSYLGLSLIESESLFREIERFILIGALNENSLDSNEISEYLRMTLIEDINEYYGLLSTSLDEQGEFHPLLSGNVFSVHFKSSRYSDSFHFIKRIGKYYILTYFNKVAETKK